MTDVLNNEIFPASGVAASMPTGNSPDDALVLSSDEESADDDFSDSQPDTSFSPISELCQRGAEDMGFGSIAAPGMSPNFSL